MNKIKAGIPPVLLISFLCILGFVSGVLTIALWQENWLVSGGVLNQDFIYEFERLKIDKRAVFFLCLGRRVRAFFLLFLLAFSSVNFFVTISFFLLSSFYVGSIMELFAIRYGIQGIAMYFTTIFPQGVFYCFGFFVLGLWCLNQEGRAGNLKKQKMEKVRKIRNKKAVFVSFMLILLGIVMESCINPKIFFFFI